MSAPKKRVTLPRHFVWSRQEHRRFQDAVEHLVGAVNDLRTLSVQLQRQIDQLRVQVASNGQAKGGVS